MYKVKSRNKFKIMSGKRPTLLYRREPLVSRTLRKKPTNHTGSIFTFIRSNESLRNSASTDLRSRRAQGHEHAESTRHEDLFFNKAMFRSYFDHSDIFTAKGRTSWEARSERDRTSKETKNLGIAAAGICSSLHCYTGRLAAIYGAKAGT